MNTYLLLKTVHILSSVLLVGTGFGSAFYMFFANRSGSVQAQAVVSRLVVRADWWFTTPAMIIQPLSGFAMMYMAGWPWHTPWLLLSMALYLFAGTCWVPVVLMQIRMARIAGTAAAQNTPMPPAYLQLARRWEILGYPAFIAMMALYALMVNKPALWG
ncbi:DUF2269 family protein [Ottowia thiooxydans]|uniref:DUF2269 family protein n=1 Tax=Ottowia thiooxydans TaxID=219182 RepID=UPI0003FC44C4|nr:DUF2269 domain-containing protein [Ottowia thiooxydans]